MLQFIKNLLWRLRGEEPLDKLIQKGLVVGQNFYRSRGAVIDSSHCFLIKIGDNVKMSPGSRILAHDGASKAATGYTRIGLVRIGNNVGMGINAMIMPGVTIGDNVIIGSSAVVTKDIPSNSIAVGNPARVIGAYDQCVEKWRNELKILPSFDASYTIDGGITNEKRQEMVQALEENGRFGYVE